MKRNVSLTLILILLISVLSQGFLTVHAVDGDYSIKPLSDSTAEITGYVGADKDITVPSVIDKYTIVRISDNAFYQNKALDAVSLPNTVQSIGEKAFAGSFIKSVDMKDSVKTLGNSAFSGCVYLESVTLSDKLGIIPNSCFSNCTRLSAINIPEGVTALEAGVFESCTHLADISLPDSLISIGEYAFAYNYSLSKIELPHNLVTISDYAFFYCTALNNISFPSSVKAIGEWAFICCSSLSSVTFSEGLEKIGANAFDSCPLGLVIIPSTVSFIGEYALGYCYDDELFDYVKYSDFVLLCPEDSVALKYAKDNEFAYNLYKLNPLGDVNLDFTVNVKDATAVQKHLAGLITLDETALLLADFNKDDTVNIKDATAIQKYVAGITL